MRLNNLGIVIDYTETNVRLLKMLNENDIHINRIEYKVDRLSELGIDYMYPYYEIKVSESVNPIRAIVFFLSSKVLTSLLEETTISHPNNKLVVLEAICVE